MSKFIELPSGDFLAAKTIQAIRLGDARPKGNNSYEVEFKPRVIVDFVVGTHANCIVLDCESNEQRDAVSRDLKTQIEKSLL